MKKKLFGLAAFCFILVAGCNRQTGPLPISEWTQYQDPYLKSNFTYPKGWHVVQEGTRISIYSSPEVVAKFFDPTSKGKEGIQLTIAYQKLEPPQALEQYVNAYTTELKSSGFTVQPTEPKQLSALQAVQVTYDGLFENNTKLHAVRIIAMQDSLVYYISYSAFNELFAPNRFLLDTLLASFELPKPKASVVAADPSIPSETFQQFENNFLKISFPDNFEPAFPQPKGEQQFAMEIRGYRQDSNIHIDALPAKGLTVEKVFEQNEKKFPGAATRGGTSIDGVKAIYLNYKPIKDIESRVYFLVKQDKVYRIILNYYQPKKKDFLPVFEKTVASIHIK